MSKENLIKQIMAEAEKDGEPVTREEAEEMAEMEIKAGNIKNYVQESAEKKARKPKERKVDEEKKIILNHLKEYLKRNLVEEVEMKTETELMFSFNSAEYSLKLIRHRPPKK